MPLYEYTNAHTGKTVELHRPVEARNDPVIIDGHVFERTKFIPDRVIVFGTQLTKEQTFDQKILKGYYRQEQEQGSRFRSNYSKQALKKVWKEAITLRP